MFSIEAQTLTDETADDTRPLSSSETARALRTFLLTSGAWGAWARIVGIGTAPFTGYVIWLGASDAQIALLVAIVHLTGLVQIASPALTARVVRRKVFILLLGSGEILLRSAIVLIPFFMFGENLVFAMGVVLAVGLICGQLKAPLYNEWIANTVPNDIRGRFTGRQATAQLIPGIVTAFAVGWYLDLFAHDEQYSGFLIVFAVATILGLTGYFNLMRIPYRQSTSNQSVGNLFDPLRHKGFRNLLFFFLSWNFALGIAGPFYSIFLLKMLDIDYGIVALLNSIFMASLVIGYKAWGGLVDRYGGKAVLRITVAPTVLIPLLWIFNTPGNYLPIAAAMFLNGFLQAGILVSIIPLLYSLLPDRESKTTHFATWSSSIQFALFLSPILGSILVKILADFEMHLLGYTIGNLQMVFFISAAAFTVPIILLRNVEDSKDTTPGRLFAHIGRGNLLSYIFGSFTFDRTFSVRTRARALRRMGRSRSPMALDRLVAALADASPEVRRNAAHGLGEARTLEAILPLAGKLADEESDVRSEAAEALGKIGDPAVIGPLVDALDDFDGRVQISAISALSEIGSEQVNELLFQKFASGFDRVTFPTLAGVLGRTRDHRMVRPTLECLQRFRSTPNQLQLLNSVCLALGADGRFYQLISQDELSRAEGIETLIKETLRRFRRNRTIDEEAKSASLKDLTEILHAYEVDDPERFTEAVRRLMVDLEAKIGQRSVMALGEEAAFRISAIVLAVNTFLKCAADRLPLNTRKTFLVVCLWSLGDTIPSIRPNE